MAVKTIALSLIASYPDGRPVTSAEFVAPLVRPDDPPLPRVIADRGKWETAKATLVLEDAADCEHASEPSEELVRRIAAGLDRATAWIGARTDSLRAMAASGLRVQIVVSAWIDQDQLDLALPAPLLAACSAAGLGILIVTNE